MRQLLFAILLILFVPAVAAAQESRTSAFPQHSWIISMDQVLSQTAITLESQSINPRGGSGAVIQIQPSADFALQTNLTLGGQLGILRNDFGNQTEFTLQVRGGYNIPIVDKFGVWLRGGLELGVGSVDDGAGGTANDDRFTLILFAPFNFFPTQHFFVGLGPFLRIDLLHQIGGNDNGRVTQVGITLTLGGVID
jgi:hypothetical protein